MTPPLSILMLGDGKPGHENQSLGLIEAIGRLTPVQVERLKAPRGRLEAMFKPPTPRRRPDLIVGAGHRTHLAMLHLSRRTDAPCVLLMKPTLPSALFDLCIIPEHDLGDRPAPPHVIVSKGALNRVPPPGTMEKLGGLILIGGPSSAHGWDEKGVIDALASIVKDRGDRPWRITDSRRTPPGTLDRITRACPALAAYPHERTGAEWLPQRLAEAAEAWVTADSISMIYESLSSGARVGLLPTPLKRDGRVTRGISQLTKEGWITPYEQWKPGRELPPAPAILREADRCAVLVVDRYFPGRMS